ncbi:MAG: NTP/NDP exchange transporter [Alphaproteobacteria bacterium]|nr:NTP/NDP exchange transporter [Rickettsiales bacterium]
MSTKSESDLGFGKLRALLWPIKGSEAKRFLLLAFVMSCILFNYTICRNTKDTLIVSSAGAGTITFLKLYLVTPAAILFLVAFTALSNVLNRERMFYALVTPFLIFFACFGLFLNPNLTSIQPDPARVADLILKHPSFTGFLQIYGNWVYSLFFVMAELWGTVVLSLAFWGFVNQTTPMKVAKRFYGMFSVVGNLALILCGYAVSSSTDFAIKYLLPQGSSEAAIWQSTVSVLMSMVVFVCLLCMAVFRYLHVTDINKQLDSTETNKKKKKKPGLLESAKLIFTSRDLGLIVMLVVCYGITINLVEVQWKNQVALRFAGNKASMNAFFGKYSFWTGMVTVFFAWFIGSNILRKFGWLFGALFTPVVILLLGSSFFFVIFGLKYAPNFIGNLFNDPVLFTTLSGAAVIILSKASKYCLFDPTKEMAYIPLDNELRSKGKAAVDVVGGRLGKSGGAFVQSTLLLLMGTTDVAQIAFIAIFVFIIMCFVWLTSVKSLGKRIADKEAEQSSKIA